MRKVSVTLAIMLLAGGCTSIPYECPLGHECIGTTDAYQAAIENRGNSESVFGEPFESDKKAATGDEQPLQGQWRPYAGGGLSDKPVYQPPQPVRIWIAPWVAEDGLLRSGQFIYATRKGGWQMGQMREEGIGGALLNPRTLLRPAPPSSGSASSPSGSASSPNRVQPQQRLIPQAED